MVIGICIFCKVAQCPPLQAISTLNCPKNDKSRTWEENQRPIITVTTVEDFWSLYNHIETPSKLPLGSDYSLFKASPCSGLTRLSLKTICIVAQEGIFPDWEDPRNAVGGRWMIGVDRWDFDHVLGEQMPQPARIEVYCLLSLFNLVHRFHDQVKDSIEMILKETAAVINEVEADLRHKLEKLHNFLTCVLYNMAEPPQRSEFLNLLRISEFFGFHGRIWQKF